jgi:hypothetical protein
LNIVSSSSRRVGLGPFTSPSRPDNHLAIIDGLEN